MTPLDDITAAKAKFRSALDSYHLTSTGYTKQPNGKNWKAGDKFMAEGFALLDSAEAGLIPPPATLPTIGRNAICSGCAAVGDHSRYAYVFLNEWDAPLIPGIKAKNPNAEVLVYKCMASARASQASGVQLNEAPEEWFAHRNGQRIEWPEPYEGHWQMRVDHSGYMVRWWENVKAVLNRDGWDGVIIDNANLTCPGGLCDEYPTQASYQAATRTFLWAKAAWLRREFFVAANIQHHGTLLTEGVWGDWVQFLSAGHLEHYTKWGNGSDQQIGGSGWETSGQAFMRESQRQGKPFLATVSCPMDDVRSQTYARCSFLMEWDGRSESALFFETNPLSADPWNAEAWRADLGKPTGAAYRIDGTTALWTRSYAGGAIYVNAADTLAVIAGRTFLPMTGLVVK